MLSRIGRGFLVLGLLLLLDNSVCVRAGIAEKVPVGKQLQKCKRRMTNQVGLVKEPRDSYLVLKVARVLLLER